MCRRWSPPPPGWGVADRFDTHCFTRVLLAPELSRSWSHRMGARTPENGFHASGPLKVIGV